MKEILMMDHEVESWRIGKIIRDIRLWTNCTQAELGRKIGKSQSEVSKLELGRMEANIHDIEKICSKFDGLTVENFTENKPINWMSIG